MSFPHNRVSRITVDMPHIQEGARQMAQWLRICATLAEDF